VNTTTELLTREQAIYLGKILGTFYVHPDIETLMSPSNSGVSNLISITDAMDCQPVLDLCKERKGYLYLIAQIDTKLRAFHVPPEECNSMLTALRSSMTTPHFFVVVDAATHGTSEFYGNGTLAHA
jgi:hypothetical protein